MCLLQNHSAKLWLGLDPGLGSLQPDANHGAGMLPIHLPQKLPKSFVGQYSSTMMPWFANLGNIALMIR